MTTDVETKVPVRDDAVTVEPEAPAVTGAPDDYWAACPSGGGTQKGRAGCYSGLPLVPGGFRAHLGHTTDYRECSGSV